MATIQSYKEYEKIVKNFVNSHRGWVIADTVVDGSAAHFKISPYVEESIKLDRAVALKQKIEQKAGSLGHDVFCCFDNLPSNNYTSSNKNLTYSIHQDM